MCAPLAIAGPDDPKPGDDANPAPVKEKVKKKKNKTGTKAKGDKTAKKEKKSKKKQHAGLYFEMKDHPAIRAGEWLKAEFEVKSQNDFRAFDPEVSGDEGDTSNMKRMRVAVQGYITKDIEFKVDREIRNETGDWFNLRTRETHFPWRDVYGNFRHFRRVQIRAGQFKIPFGLDQMHGTTNGDFVFRSQIGEWLSPGRDVGIMAHGKLADSRIQYQAGVFVHDGWRAHTKDYDYSGERAIAGRVVVPPFEFIKVPSFFKPLKNLELGAAIVQSPVTEGLNSVRGRTWVITTNYFPRIDVRGQRLRVGTELNWTPGPFSLRGEVIHVTDQRVGQGFSGENLSDLIARGWYLSGSWVITGEKKGWGVTPRHPFVTRDFMWGHGPGALEIAGRYEQIRFGSAEHPGLPSRSPRAANILSSSERVLTTGVNWYLNKWTRVQFDAIREVIEDTQRAPIVGQSTYWSKYVRIQFVL